MLIMYSDTMIKGTCAGMKKGLESDQLKTRPAEAGHSLKSIAVGAASQKGQVQPKDITETTDYDYYKQFTPNVKAMRGIA